jgi:uncharacterized membrane protein
LNPLATLTLNWAVTPPNKTCGLGVTVGGTTVSVAGGLLVAAPRLFVITTM